MLSVIITPGDPRRLPALLAALTPAAVDAIVGDLRIVAPISGLIEALCDETGADRTETVAEAIAASRLPRLLVAPPEFRPRDGWLEALGDHLRAGGGEAVIRGRGLFAPPALVVMKARVERLLKPDFQRVRRNLDRGLVRL